MGVPWDCEPQVSLPEGCLRMYSMTTLENANVPSHPLILIPFAVFALFARLPAHCSTGTR
jgi:hypothetical protein